MKLRRDVAGFAVGLLCGGVIFGGVGIASGVIATPLTESSQKVTLDGPGSEPGRVQHQWQQLLQAAGSGQGYGLRCDLEQ